MSAAAGLTGAALVASTACARVAPSPWAAARALPWPKGLRCRSVRVSGWQVAQLCHFWKHRFASWKAISPRRTESGSGASPTDADQTVLPRSGSRHVTVPE